jgi:hypothetical protein
MIKRVSGLGLIVSPTTAPRGINIDTTVDVTPFFVLKSDARNTRNPTMGTIMNKKSISSLLLDGQDKKGKGQRQGKGQGVKGGFCG